ncbi:MAG TPA: glycosyltransferase family 4 protein [Bacillota bacterium]|nr:glycosyltransferase family 4 protein [Bacillota bacterium]
MRIIYLSRSLLPSKAANSVQVMKMCQALAQQGHELHLVAARYTPMPLDSLFDYYGVSNRFKITLLKGRTDKVHGLFFYLLRFYFFLKKTAIPDLIFSRDLFTLTLATFFYNVPFYFEAHKPPTSFIHFCLTRRLMRNRNLKKLIVITNALQEEYRRLFPELPEEKIMVAPDGSDIPDSDGVEDTVLPNSRPTIGYVGSLYPGRGLEIILELAKRLPQYDFLVVGGSEKDVERWRNSCISQENLCFTGHVPPGELARYYRKIDIVLAPYQEKVAIPGGGDTARWMSPLKIFEYMAYGKPIIASDLPALKEILIHGHNALLCPPGRLDEWTRAVQLLAGDQNLRDRLAAAAFSCLQEKYTWEKRAAQILEGL